MPHRYPAEVRRQVIELARSGTKVAQLAATFGMSDATIYNWLKQDRVDRGEVAGLGTEEALDLAAVADPLSSGLLPNQCRRGSVLRSAPNARKASGSAFPNRRQEPR
jgi:transposase-like protein